MTQTLSNEFDELRSSMSGPVITPADPDYDRARTIWNAEVDRRPSAIARCVSAADVAEAHGRVVAQIREALPPLFEMTTPMPYVALQTMLDEANAWGNYGYDKHCYVAELSDPVIETVTDHVPGKSSPLSVVLFYPLDRAYCAMGEDETAFGGGRSPRFTLFVVGLSPDAAGLPAERAWVQAFQTAMAPLAIGRETYVNAILEDGGDRELRDVYGSAKYERLSRVKAEYDPGNVFRSHANIKPS